MPIELHCPKCQKPLRAPDDAGGKRSKCPGCGNSVYIPMPVSDEDIIPLAPIDEDEERRAEEERRESLRFAAIVDKATEGGAPDPGSKGKPAAGARPAPRAADAPGVVVELKTEVESFVLAMKDSKLDVAEAAVGRLRKAGDRARDYVQTMMLDEIPPKIGNLPPPLIQGFLKNLLGRLS